MRIAIIGTGISALSTAFYLDKNIDIDLYDSEDRLGGHTVMSKNFTTVISW